ALIADARVEGYKIMPLCPFVNAERKKHPEWANAFNV
ncbi:MAG: N-acetyltransferase, partial [Boseongicola sp.]|nr:N-acetyltransferase [Boseongicola sp.]